MNLEIEDGKQVTIDDVLAKLVRTVTRMAGVICGTVTDVCSVCGLPLDSAAHINHCRG